MNRVGSAVSVLLVGIPLLLTAASGEEGPGVTPPPMTQARMEGVVRDVVGATQGQPGFIQFAFDGVPMACISDVRHDRMRLIAPVRKTSELTPAEKDRILEANFHTALDARYATSRETLYAVFVHPLSSLTEKDLRAAIHQVSTLAKTFGTSYSSGDLSFGGSR